MRICVTYDEFCTHNEREGVEYGSWSEHYDSSVTGAYRIGDDEKAPWDSETFVVPDDATEVFVVYMIYSTGDSFGNADGKIDIMHCTSNEEAADALAKQVVENNESFSIKFTDDFGREISIDNRGAGYFEHIDHIGVERFTVGSGKSQRRYHIN